MSLVRSVAPALSNVHEAINSSGLGVLWAIMGLRRHEGRGTAMNEKVVTLATALTLVVLIGVGFVDAVRDDDTGTAVLFALVLVGVLSLARTRAGAGSVALRRDLASWLDRTSPVTGETADELANRAVSRLRAGFSPPGEATL